MDEAADQLAAAAAAEEEEEGEEGEREAVNISKKSMYWDEKRLEEKLGGLEKVDPYGLLGLEDRRWRASADELKKSYRRLVLEKHPDKRASNGLEMFKKKSSEKLSEQAAEKAAGEKKEKVEKKGEKEKKGKKAAKEGVEEDEEEGEEEEDEEFKLLALAWELLGNEEKRRQFDSVDFFNDNMPSTFKASADEPGRFYKVFGPVFARQGKFSVAKPVPLLGDNKTPIEEVLKFYNFWGGVRSWRDFTLLGEHTPTEAQDRIERRWMQRQNQNEVEKLKRAELKRLNEFVSLARENDPRLIRAREERAAEKERVKAEREEVFAAEVRAKEAVEEAKRAAEAEVVAAAAKKKAVEDSGKKDAKAEKEKARSALKKARKELKALSEEGKRWASRASDLEAVASGLSIGELEALTATLAGQDDAAAVDALAAALKKVMV